MRLGRRNLAELPAAERAQAIGFLPQHFEPHWDLSVGRASGDRCRPGAQPAGGRSGKDGGRLRAGGLERRRWSTLSGGERARVLLAMVLVVDPPVLLADEPAASLDIRHRLDFAGVGGARGRTGCRWWSCMISTLPSASSTGGRAWPEASWSPTAGARLVDDPRSTRVRRAVRAAEDRRWRVAARDEGATVAGPRKGPSLRSG